MLRFFVSTMFVLVAFASGVSYGEEIKVTQKGKEFKIDGKKVEELKIKSGDSIEFVNDDSAAHSVFSTSENYKFNLKIQKPNTSSKQTFVKKGEAMVRCAIHPKMKLKVIVE